MVVDAGIEARCSMLDTSFELPQRASIRASTTLNDLRTNMLEDKLNKDLKTSLKEKDTTKISVIRMLKAEITNTAIKLKKKVLTDEDVLKIIQNHISRHKDSIEQFKKGNRDDLVQKEEKELEILKSYVPEQLSDTELETLVKSTIDELGATTKKEMGKVIKTVLEIAKGKADGKRVSQMVSRFLTG